MDAFIAFEAHRKGKRSLSRAEGFLIDEEEAGLGGWVGRLGVGRGLGGYVGLGGWGLGSWGWEMFLVDRGENHEDSVVKVGAGWWRIRPDEDVWDLY